MNIKHWITVFILMLLLPSFLSVHDDADDVSAGRTRSRETSESWTILSYMNGEDNLEKFIVGDLMEMESINRPSDVNIVVQIDLGTNDNYASPHASWTDTRRYRVEHHPEDGIGSTRLDDLPLGEIDMDDPASLNDFIEWGITNYPADHYMLALEGHSGGPARGLMEDRSSSLGDPYTMDVHLMGEAIRDAVDDTIGRPLDVISFDVCWMGMAEAAAEVMDHAMYMVGSFDEIPGAGWPYDKCLARIIDDTSITLEQRLELVVDEFIDHYDPDGSESYASLSVIDLSRFRDQLVPALEYLAREMFYSAYEHRMTYSSLLSLVDKPRLRNDKVWDRYVDLYQMSELLSLEKALPERVRDAGRKVMETEGSVLVASKGGANHPGSSRLFGIYYPTVRNDQGRYSPLILSELTAWDEHAATVVEGFDLTAKGINWTDTDPGSITFELSTGTPNLVSKVRLAVVLDGSEFNYTLTGQGGSHVKTVNTQGAVSIDYRYSVTGLYGNTVTFPPDGLASARISMESDPPEVWHWSPDTVTLSQKDGGLTFWIRDRTGIESSEPSGIPRMEYRRSGDTSWFSVPLTEIDSDPFRGWIRYWGLPSGIEPGTGVEYHIFVSDVYGNNVRYPLSGELNATMSVGKSFYLDTYRSDIKDHGKLVDMFQNMGMAVELGTEEEIPDLSTYKGYIIIQPRRPLSPDDADALMEQHEEGVELLLIIDPNDGDQEVDSRWLLEGLNISLTGLGSVNGFYPSAQVSELGNTLPSLAGSCQGSIDIGSEMSPVYYTTPPHTAMVTGRKEKGKSVVSLPCMLSDSMMDREANRQIAELIISHLQANDPPVIDVDVEPQGVAVPGESVSFDLSGSTDRDGYIVGYAMSVSDNTHKEGPNATFLHTFSETGVYTIYLEITDSEGGTSMKTLSLKVNRPPSTDHGISSKTIHAGDSVIFDYKGDDPDGDEVYILWDFGDGYMVSGKTVSHEYTMRGIYTYKLTLRDSNGIEVNTTGRIIVDNSDPTAVIDRDSIKVGSREGNFTGPSKVTLVVGEGDRIYIPGDLSDDRDMDDELNYTWKMGDGTVLHGIQAIHEYRISGLFELELVVNDGHGGTDNTTMLVSVNNNLPVAAFAAEEDGDVFRFDASMTSDDPWDMDEMEYRWDFGDGNTVTTREPFTEHEYGLGGRYEVTLTVTDDNGAMDSHSVEVEADGLTSAEVIIIISVILIVLLISAIVAVMYMKNRAEDQGKSLVDLFRKEPVSEEDEGGFSSPTPKGPDQVSGTSFSAAKVSNHHSRYQDR